MMARERIKRFESSLLPWIVAGIALALGLGLGAYLFFKEAAPPEPPVREDTFGAVTGYAGPSMTVRLFFPSQDGDHLVAEVRDVRHETDMNLQVRSIVEQLIRGPEGNLTPSFPAGSRVKGVFMDASGTVYVDFSHELQTEFPGGAWTETLTVYSLVNTLAAAFPETVNHVKIIVDGHEIPTLAGHVDTSEPFAPRMALVKGN